MDAQTAEDAAICSGGIFREAVGSSAVVVNRFDFRPDPIKMGSDAVGTKTDGI